jgi:hypothetical protein
MSMAHRLSLELRAAEDRIAELQAETERLQTRAARAEQWLEAIKNKFEDKLIASNRREPPGFLRFTGRRLPSSCLFSVRLKITWAQASPQSLAGCRQLRHGARNRIDAGG